MIDMTEFEQKLRAEVAEAEANAERAFASFRETDAHPNSTEYQMVKTMTMMAGGVYTGLTKALSLITGDQEFERANALVLSWIKPST